MRPKANCASITPFSLFPLVLRPALIGLALALAAMAVFFLTPERTSEPALDRAALPPALYPVFPSRSLPEGKTDGAIVGIEKTPAMRDVPPGGTIEFRIGIENTGDGTLRNLTVEERFDASLLHIVDPGTAAVGENRMIWEITELPRGIMWEARYTMAVGSSVQAGAIESTAYVFGEDIADMASAPRLRTSRISVVGMPITGAGLGWFLRLMRAPL